MIPKAPSLPLRYPFPLGELGGLPPLIRWAQTHQPVCPVRLPSGEEIWMLTRRDDITRVFADSRFSGRRTVGHSRIAAQPFARRALAGYRRQVAEHADELLDAMADGPCPADLVTAYVQPLRLRVARRVIGLPTRLWPEHERILGTMASILSDSEQVAEEMAGIRRLVTTVLAERADSASDDLVGELLAARRAGRLRDDELADLVAVLLATGTDAGCAPTAEGALIMMEHRNQLADCLADPANWPHAADEVLRFYHNGLGSGMLGSRVRATEDVTVHGTVVRATETVVASLRAATWDPAYVRQPDKFRIGRTAPITVGAGPQGGLGSQLARAYVATALRSLFERFPTLFLSISANEIPWRNDLVATHPVLVPVAW